MITLQVKGFEDKMVALIKSWSPTGPIRTSEYMVKILHRKESKTWPTHSFCVNLRVWLLYVLKLSSLPPQIIILIQMGTWLQSTKMPFSSVTVCSWFHTGTNAPLHSCNFSDWMSFLLWLSERTGRIILAKHCRIWRIGFLEKKGNIWSIQFW